MKQLPDENFVPDTYEDIQFAIYSNLNIIIMHILSEVFRKLIVKMKSVPFCDKEEYDILMIN